MGSKTEIMILIEVTRLLTKKKSEDNGNRKKHLSIKRVYTTDL